MMQKWGNLVPPCILLSEHHDHPDPLAPCRFLLLAELELEGMIRLSDRRSQLAIPADECVGKSRESSYTAPTEVYRLEI